MKSCDMGRIVRSVEDTDKNPDHQRFLFFCERLSNILRFTSIFVDEWTLYTGLPRPLFRGSVDHAGLQYTDAAAAGDLRLHS